ncbi:MAG: HAD hydrolase-like protein, partial [Ktedonobacterales bacterium]
NAYAPSLPPTPGARDLVLALQRRGQQTVVSSSAKRDELETLLRAAQVDGLLRETTTQDDVEQSKPAPDAVQVAFEKMRLPPEACVMIVDTPYDVEYDVESAQRAGVTTLAVRSGGWDGAALAGAHAFYDDPPDLLAHVAQSPLATS